MLNGNIIPLFNLVRIHERSETCMEQYYKHEPDILNIPTWRVCGIEGVSGMKASEKR